VNHFSFSPQVNPDFFSDSACSTGEKDKEFKNLSCCCGSFLFLLLFISLLALYDDEKREIKI